MIFPSRFHSRMSRQVANEEIKSGRGEQAIYSERYVAFVDILGFSRIVRDSVQSTVQATKLAGTLNRIANRSERSHFPTAPCFLKTLRIKVFFTYSTFLRSSH
jgi:hypothetical protein